MKGNKIGYLFIASLTATYCTYEILYPYTDEHSSNGGNVNTSLLFYNNLEWL